MVSERRQHRDERVVSICQGKSAECVKDVDSVGDGWKQPVKVDLVGALRKKCGDLGGPPGVRVKPSGRRGEEGSETSIVVARLLLCCVSSMSARRPSHSFVSRMESHLLYWATVASKVMGGGWKSSCSKMLPIRSDRSPCL